MAGTLRIEIDDEKVKRALNGLATCVANTRPVLKVIGERMLRHIDEGFTRETSPGGNKWQAVAPATAKGKRNPKILTGLGEAGGLRGTIAYRMEGNNTLLIGANKPYAAIHQLGGNAGRGGKAKIPARPYLGISAAAKEDISSLIGKAVRESLGG